jgi:hypothetical protein
MKLLAGIDVPNPIDIIKSLHLPSVSADGILNGMTGWVLDQLGISRANSLQTAMNVLDSTRRPNLAADWFDYALGNSMGVAFQMSVIVLAFTAFITMLRRDGWFRMGRNLFDAFVIVMWAQLFFFVLGIAFTFSDGLTQIFKLLGSVPGREAKNWKETLLELPAVSDLFGNAMLRGLGTCLGWLLSAETFVLAIGIYFIAIAGVFSFRFRDNGKTGGTIWRWTVSGFLAIIFAKPAMMFCLALGSAIIQWVPMYSKVNFQVGMSLVCTALACAMPLILLFAANTQYARVEGYINSFVKNDIVGRFKTDDVIRTESEEHHLESLGISGGQTLPVEIVDQEAQQEVAHNFSTVVMEGAAVAGAATGHPEVAAAAEVAGIAAQQASNHDNGSHT